VGRKAEASSLPACLCCNKAFILSEAQLIESTLLLLPLLHQAARKAASQPLCGASLPATLHSPRAARESMMRFTHSSCSTLRGVSPLVMAATKATIRATRLIVSCRAGQRWGRGGGMVGRQQ
jgi:hypothetical protein